MANSDGESGSDNAEMTNSKHEYVTQESTRLDVELPVLEDMITPNDDGRSLGSEIPDSEADLASSSPVKESPVAISEGQEAVEDTPANIEMPVEGTSGVQNERMKDVIDCEIGNLEMWKNSDGEDVQAALESRSSVVISDEQSESTALGTEVFMKFTREGPRAMEDAASPTVVDSESDSSTANTTDTEVKLSSSGGQSLLTNEGPTPADDTPLTVETSSSLATLKDVGNGDYDMLMDTSEKLLGSGQLVLEMLGPKDRLSTEEEDVQSIQYHIKMDQTSLVLNEVLTTFQSPETDHIPNDFSAPKAQRTDRDGDKQPSQTSKSEAPSLPCKPDSSRVPEPNNQPSQNPSSAINPIPSLSASTKSPSSLDVSPSRPDGFQNKDVVMAELKNMKMASIQARNAALEAQITNQRARLEQVSKDLRYPAAETVKRHIKLLHDYNDIRDVGQGLIGMIADNRGVRIGELYDEFGVGLND